MRQIVLDTETTGLNVDDGHRIIEVGCVELVSRKLTGNHFHHYIYPEREVEAGAMAVHGITNAFLKDKPTFDKIAKDLLDFISGAELIIHNAPFDLSFLNHEFKQLGQGYKPVTDYCGVTDSLLLARKLHVGQRNSLDALCKRYGIDLSKREMHGALLDANLLAQVYLAMTGGQSSLFDGLKESKAKSRQTNKTITPLQKHELIILKADEEEVSRHKNYLELMKNKGKCLWQDLKE